MPTRFTDTDIRAAALQYVRKVSGFRAPPASHNAAAFERAVDEIAGGDGGALLGTLEVRHLAGLAGIVREKTGAINPTFRKR